MTPIDQKDEARFKTARLFAYITLVAAPIVYLFVAFIVKLTPQEGGEHLMMFYILLIVAVVAPAMFPIIERMHITQYKSGRSTEMTPASLYTTVSMMKYAFVEATYLFGLVIFFVSGDINRVFYFYPIGIIWTFIYWPRRDKFEQFLQKLERP